MNGLYLIILSLIGFAASFYIFISKKQNKKLYCILGQDCDDVVKSDYGKTFGIENTVPGMAYYALIFMYGVYMLSNGNIFKYGVFYYFVVSASALTVLFSAYLTSVQAFVLKKWCEFCLISSLASLFILLVLVL